MKISTLALEDRHKAAKLRMFAEWNLSSARQELATVRWAEETDPKRKDAMFTELTGYQLKGS